MPCRVLTRLLAIHLINKPSRTLETHRISQHTQYHHHGCMPPSFTFLVGSHLMHHTAEQSRYFQPHYQASDVEATGVAALTTAISRKIHPSTFLRKKLMTNYYYAFCLGKISQARHAEQADRLAAVLRTTSFDGGVGTELKIVSRATNKEPRYASTVSFHLSHMCRAERLGASRVLCQPSPHARCESMIVVSRNMRHVVVSMYGCPVFFSFSDHGV